MLHPADTRKTYTPISRAVCLCFAQTLISLFFILILITPQKAVNALGQTPKDEAEVVRVTTDLLLFPIRIRDKQRRSVPGLTEHDLSLTDKDHATTALHFSAGSERVAMVFALDQSGSLRQIISAQRNAALALFGHFSQRSRIAVIRFAEAPQLVAPFGRDTDAAQAAFSFSVGNQHTAIFDAARMAITTLNQLAGDRAERRIVILISDGLDNASKAKASDVIEDALEKHVSFYVIHLPLFEPREGRLAVRQPARGFRDLAEKTGGKYFLVGDQISALKPAENNDLTPVFQAIEEDLKSQYLLGFYIAESARDGRRHRFSVSLLPRGLEYSVGKLGYSRTHDFFVNMQRDDAKAP